MLKTVLSTELLGRQIRERQGLQGGAVTPVDHDGAGAGGEVGGGRPRGWRR